MDSTDPRFKKAKSLALWHLNRRSMPTARLREKLLAKEHLSEVAEAVISYLTDLGYLNDLAWAESYVRVQQRKGKGPRWILQNLQRRYGISEENSQRAVKAYAPKDSQEDSIRGFLEKRYSLEDLRNHAKRSRAVNTLLRKGFSYATIASVLESERFTDVH